MRWILRSWQLVVVLAAVTGSCSSAHRVDDVDPPDRTTFDAATGTQVHDAALHASAHDGGPGTDGDDASVSCPGARHGRSFVITNSSSQTQYLNVGFDQPFSLARQLNGHWSTFFWGPGHLSRCGDDCGPIDWELCPPTVRILASGEALTYNLWGGSVYLRGPDITCEWDGPDHLPSTGGTISCSEQHEAPAGRYRVELCHSANYVEEGDVAGSCHGGEDEGYQSPASLGPSACPVVEFDYDPCLPGTVEIVILDP